MRWLLRSKLFLFASLLVVVGPAVGLYFAVEHRRNAPAGEAQAPDLDEDEDQERKAEAVRVRTIRPRCDPSFAVSLQPLAVVKAYYQADLKARVAGIVRCVKKDLGERVKKGELLVEIDVPDLLMEVTQKEAIVAQRRQELRISQSNRKTVEAQLDVVRAGIDQRKAEVDVAVSTRDFKQKRLARYEYLAKRDAINEDQVDEQKREYEGAVASVASAQAALQKAKADLKEKEASLEAAGVDVDLKNALIVVAERDRDRLKALSDYANITAPFDGVVARRYVDLGDFVQDSTRSNAEPLLTLMRTDLVTVVAKVPDNAVPFVSKSTPVQILIDQLPGVVIESKLTRHAPAIDTNDRTMQVEVDLLNALDVVDRDLKGAGGELPIRPTGLNLDREGQRLAPGMNGYMRLQLRAFANAHLVPSSAVFTRAGKPYLMVVRNGEIKLLPVRVQVNDGTLSKVALLQQTRDPVTGAIHESLQELTGEEEIVASRQAELTEGQVVQTARQDW